MINLSQIFRLFRATGDVIMTDARPQIGRKNIAVAELLAGDMVMNYDAILPLFTLILKLHGVEKMKSLRKLVSEYSVGSFPFFGQ